MHTGFVFYEGPSMIDDEPIIGVATIKTVNPKTGQMIQTWILRQQELPSEALKLKNDVSICGNCPLRNNGCYVNVWQGPNGVWKKWKRKGYLQPELEDLEFLAEEQFVRLGSYGDPAAIPIEYTLCLLKRCLGNTGYTHQWRERHARGYKRFCMASVETNKEYHLANSMGWRTFRVRPINNPNRIKGEAQCPAADEAGNKITCAECMACCGTRNGYKGNISIQAHGRSAARVHLIKEVA
jgi:hypothetical protein